MNKILSLHDGTYNFDVREATKSVIQQIRDWFNKNGKNSPAVIGISGGKDSSVVAALCVKALGKERVVGVLMPNGEQSDIGMSHLLCSTLDIKEYTTINIHSAFDSIVNAYPLKVSKQALINLAPRLRMSTLYFVSQCFNGRVMNTCNLSEDWVGYSTRYGDSAGDYCPIARFTKTEVVEIGRYLGLPSILCDKVPSDGLCGKTDEDNLGFTYEVLDRYLRTGYIEDAKIKEIIDKKHEQNKFKMSMPECAVYGENPWNA